MNPFAEHEVETRSMSDLFGNRITFAAKEKFETPGDFLKYFSQKTGLPIGRLGWKLKGMMDVRTLFHIKSVCDKSLLEGTKTNYLHAFNSCLYVPKET